ncbi:uncharacterized protein B0I36DRAFT_347546 [Microdochium trichocladiopsis]|uniref:Uncharacterized protein n=1 Tax=Microdochium trichocladiopsis TaxID=1682393 RepID=A0A9P9BRE3_9PEZI|nr:uncharacterized protein B0I36DRAFT_347546 [Microdochium trichocladiopsis]KAH7035818.1 hypothetical protein B0I36DRAFT_347546 [Microdochium trichocladiopsis]
MQSQAVLRDRRKKAAEVRRGLDDLVRSRTAEPPRDDATRWPQLDSTISNAPSTNAPSTNAWPLSAVPDAQETSRTLRIPEAMCASVIDHQCTTARLHATRRLAFMTFTPTVKRCITT